MADKTAVKVDKSIDAPPEVAADAVENPDAATPKRSRLAGLFPLIKAVAFISVLVAVEVVAASMFIPSAQDTERLAKQYVAATQGQTAPSGGETAVATEAAAQGEVNEVELGTFNVTHFNPTANATLSIDFELFGAVLATDEKEFHTLLDKNKVRVREQVIMTLHAAEAKDLSDAGLGLLKRQILEKTNRALGQPLIKEVLFSKFNFVER
ncbi:MAG TPA: flagellar basal body-associated FliL family protein [Lacipirellulaceae bacterium]